MLAVFDPVGIGVVKSLERPGTNVTGTTMYAPQLIGERLRILKRIVPNLDKVAMALNGNNANNAAQFELLRSEAQKLGIEVQSLDIRNPEDVDAAFDKALAFGAKGLVNGVDTFINSQTLRAGSRGGKTQIAVRLQRRGICHGRRADGAWSGSLRGLLRRRQIRGQDFARRKSG